MVHIDVGPMLQLLYIKFNMFRAFIVIRGEDRKKENTPAKPCNMYCSIVVSPNFMCL